MMDFHPYADESAALELGGLTLENHRDRVAVYGQMNITKDQQGLSYALSLQSQLAQIIAALQTAALPEHIESAPVVMVKNPFA